MTLETLLGVQLSSFIFPLFRVMGLIMAAPVFGSRLVPNRIKIVLALCVTLVIVPTLPEINVAGGWLLSGFVALQETLIGVAMALVVQMMFDALVIAGQTIAMTMGLGFAMLVDPHRGVSVPVLSQFFIIVGILVFLSLNGHLALLQMVSDSFTILPVGQLYSVASVWWLLEWGSQMFIGAVSIALPAVMSILVVNIAFGVMSRAAPTLNLFAIGFPSALLIGFIVLLLNMQSLASVFSELIRTSLLGVIDMIGS
jgi:flagellar biosynthetic protein FliR